MNKFSWVQFGSVTQLCPTLRNPMNCTCSVMSGSLWPMDCRPPGSSVHGISHILNGMGCHFLLQGIFLPQGSNPPLLHWQTDSEPQWHLGSPKVQRISSHNRCTCFIISRSPQSAGRIRCPWWHSWSPLLWFSSFFSITLLSSFQWFTFHDTPQEWSQRWANIQVFCHFLFIPSSVFHYGNGTLWCAVSGFMTHSR